MHDRIKGLPKFVNLAKDSTARIVVPQTLLVKYDKKSASFLRQVPGLVVVVIDLTVVSI